MIRHPRLHLRIKLDASSHNPTQRQNKKRLEQASPAHSEYDHPWSMCVWRGRGTWKLRWEPGTNKKDNDEGEQRADGSSEDNVGSKGLEHKREENMKEMEV